MLSVTEYEKHFHNSTHYKTSFSLMNVPVYVANSIRRALSSMVPTITFDDSHYEDKSLMSIQISKNTSALHDQFLSHRISYVPINMENHSYFNIETILNNDTSDRTFVFNKLSKNVEFKLNKKNNSLQNEFRDKQGLIDVTTNDFIIVDGDGVNIDTDVFFKPDVFTGDYVLLNKLKQDLSNEDGGEEILIDCVPRIGMGRFSSKNDPTGTVTYQMHQDTEEAINSVFKHKKTHLNKERNKKGLDDFTAEEEVQFRKSFDLLDRDRVIKTDENGNPNAFRFSVESIGFLNPNTIIIDALGVLILSLKDIQNSFTFRNDKYGFATTNKISITELDSSNVNIGININVKNENHTIGNMLSNIIRNMWCHMGTELEEPILKMVSYKMNHPTIEDIDFVLIPETITNADMVEHIHMLYSNDRTINMVPIAEKEILSSKGKAYIVELLCVLLFQKAINNCMNTLLDIKLKLCDQMDVTDNKTVSYLIKDGDDYMAKNIELIGNVTVGGYPNDYPHLNNISEILGKPKTAIYAPESPTLDPVSPTLDPVSPTYAATSPTLDPVSPTYAATSPTLDPVSPILDPVSPVDQSTGDVDSLSDESIKPPVKYGIPVPKWLSSVITEISLDEYHTIMRFLSEDYTNSSGEDTVEIILDDDVKSMDSSKSGKTVQQILILNYATKTWKRVNRVTKK